MIPTLSARISASSRYWVVRKIVTPSSRFIRRTSSHTAARPIGLSPVVGSSRKSTFRIVYEGRREIEPALHASGVGLYTPVERLADVHQRLELLNPPVYLRLTQPIQLALQPQQLAPSLLLVQRGFLKGRTDAEPHLPRVRNDVVARYDGSAPRSARAG